MLFSKCHRKLMQNSLNGNQDPTLLNYLIQRGIAMTVVVMNHYKILGLAPSATQNDIKSAYYKLSMMYHPDKNKGSDSAAIKFREITGAYEVLGNHRLRRLYDKGILHTAGTDYGTSESDFYTPEDDAQTKFYKAREKRAEVPHHTGKTPIYNFDEWSRAHYASSFNRKQDAKTKYDFKKARKHEQNLIAQNEFVFFGIFFIIIIIHIIMMNDFDKDKTKKKPKYDE